MHGGMVHHVSVGGYLPAASFPAGSGETFTGLLHVLFPSSTVSADADLDENGLPDWWELEHFGVVGIDPDDDPDQDGATNRQEFGAGTHPLNVFSVFSLRILNTGSGLSLELNTIPGRIYRILQSSELSSPSLLAEQTASSSLLVIHLGIQPEPIQFFWAEVLQPNP